VSSLTSSISWLCLDVSDCISLLNSSFVCQKHIVYNNREKRRTGRCKTNRQGGIVTRSYSMFSITSRCRKCNFLSVAQVYATFAIILYLKILSLKFKDGAVQVIYEETFFATFTKYRCDFCCAQVKLIRRCYFLIFFLLLLQ